MRFLVFLLFSSLSLVAQPSVKTASNVTDFTIVENRVEFTLEDKSKVQLLFCSRAVVRFWYEPSGVFSRRNESFAVVNEMLEEMGSINVDEQAQAYEIFTDFLRVRINKKPFQILIFDKYQKLLLGDYKDKGVVSQEDWIGSYKMLRADEQIFGLGEKAGSLNRRGKAYTMWNSDKPCYGVAEDPLYKSIPFFMSNYNYGIFFDNTFKSEFKFGTQSEEYFSFEAPGGELLYYFIFGNDYKQIISRYTQLTGHPIMPPSWALGFSQCRGMLTREDLTYDIAKGYRDRKIPCDIIFQDIGWTQALQDFEWRRGNYSNPKQMLTDLSNNGFKVVVSQDPVISQANKKQWNEADSLGYFTTDVRTGKSYDMPWPWGGNCGVVDFTKPGVDEWWGNYQQKPVQDGVRGFWTDMGEPAWSNEESTERLYMEHHRGMHNEIHNVYGLTWDKVVTEQFEKHNPNKRIFQMTRAGYAGMQRYTFGWSGDSGNGNNVLNGWAQLANQIPVGLSAGLGLIPFWSSDISGYCGDIYDHNQLGELYLRWLQFGVFNPISRAHHEGNNAVEPWLFGEDISRMAKKAIELKYTLFPYIYSYAREAHESGVPIMRPMFLEFPNDPEAFKADHQYMFGKELLVAPVVEKGADSKHIYLPEGEWIDYKDGKTIYKGLRWIDYDVTLESIPLFVKHGSIIPTMPVMQFIHEQKDYPLYITIYPGNGLSEFTLYEDDGETKDYSKGHYVKTKLSLTKGKDETQIKIVQQTIEEFSPTSRNLVFSIPQAQAARMIYVDGVKLKLVKNDKLKSNLSKSFNEQMWSYDKVRKMITICIPTTRKESVIRIVN